MNSTRFIRTLLLAMWAAAIGGAALDFALESSLPQPLADWIAETAEAESTPLEWMGVGIGLAALVALIWSTVLLWQLDRKGGRMLLVSLVLGLGAMACMGPIVLTPWGYLLSDLSSVLGGVILGWIYFGGVTLDREADSNLGTRRDPPLPPI